MIVPAGTPALPHPAERLVEAVGAVAALPRGTARATAAGFGVVLAQLTPLHDAQRRVRGEVSSIACKDGIRPPGKMYFWIQPKLRRVASTRSCAMVIAWMPTTPPGASSRSSVVK